MSKYWLGKKLSQKTKNKLSISHLKNPTRYWLGKKRSLETIKKMSISSKGKKISKETRERISNTLTGTHRPEEVKNKIRNSQVGEKGNNWKGGIYKTNNDIRRSPEYKFWNKGCLLRDNFTCQKYKISGGELVVHHINNFADFPEFRFAIDNGITLSIKAHKEFHKKYGIKNNTREQLNEFLQSL